MKHNEKLPDKRFGAVLLTRLEGEDTFVLPVRDAGAPSQPKRLDGQMGIVEDEKIKDAQARESTEEKVFVREKDGSAEIGVPETIRGTDLEHNLVRNYRNTDRDEGSPLPEAEGVLLQGLQGSRGGNAVHRDLTGKTRDRLYDRADRRFQYRAN